MVLLGRLPVDAAEVFFIIEERGDQPLHAGKLNGRGDAVGPGDVLDHLAIRNRLRIALGDSIGTDGRKRGYGRISRKRCLELLKTGGVGSQARQRLRGSCPISDAVPKGAAKEKQFV